MPSNTIEKSRTKTKKKTNYRDSAVLIITLTAAERKACDQAAKLEEIKLSDWIRNALLRAAGLAYEED